MCPRAHLSSLCYSLPTTAASLKEIVSTELTIHCDVDQFSNVILISQFQKWIHFCTFIGPIIVIFKSVLSSAIP